jgi:3-hydroxyisobutyrate dehydrogenase-like beta-hydroxyacid dehydrogenase
MLSSARAVAEQYSLLLLALPDDGVTRAILAEITPALAAGATILDVTTGDPEAAQQFGQSLAEHGVIYLDTPISGSSSQVLQGGALFMVGGPAQAFELLRDLLVRLAGEAIHTGPCGSAAKMKLVTNLVLGLNRAALAEGLVLAQSLGLEMPQALAVLTASMAYSRIMDSKGEKMVQGDFTPQAKLSQHLKDVRLMLSAAARSNQQLPLSQTHSELLERAVALGFGDLDNSAILRAIDRIKPGSDAESSGP